MGRGGGALLLLKAAATTTTTTTTGVTWVNRGERGLRKIQNSDTYACLVHVWPMFGQSLIMVFASLKIRSGFLVPVFGFRKSTVPVMFHFVPKIQKKTMIVTVFPGSNFTQCLLHQSVVWLQ